MARTERTVFNQSQTSPVLLKCIMYSHDFRWRAVFLIHVYGISVQYVSDIFGPSVRTIQRWYCLLLSKGVVENDDKATRSSRWPCDVVRRVRKYVEDHPTFYLEELQEFMKHTFPELKNVSLSTICRALHFDMNLTRKVLTKAARECVPHEVHAYKVKLEAMYSYPEQLLFIDETAKDGRHAYRRYAWSKTNTKAVVRLPFSRGKRLSILAALDHSGFVAWVNTEGTYTRNSFHRAFVEKILPLLNPWPLPRSIVVMDNAKIHMYRELESVIHQAGARLLYLPPYSPQLNPIEICFGLLKRWIQKNANLVFPLYPALVLDVAMRSCCRTREAIKRQGVLNLYAHCGYDDKKLPSSEFIVRQENEVVSDDEQ